MDGKTLISHQTMSTLVTPAVWPASHWICQSTTIMFWNCGCMRVCVHTKRCVRRITCSLKVWFSAWTAANSLSLSLSFSCVFSQSLRNFFSSSLLSILIWEFSRRDFCKGIQPIAFMMARSCQGVSNDRRLRRRCSISTSRAIYWTLWILFFIMITYFPKLFCTHVPASQDTWHFFT